MSDPAVPEPQRPARALRLLEAARGVLLSQALSTRGDLSELRARYPELAARFIELRDMLDRPSPAAGTDLAGLPDVRTADAVQRMIRDRRQTDEEFTQLLARIRGLAGFGTFALPPALEQLMLGAAEGPVVVFNVSAYRSDAILLTSEGITSRNLPGLDQATVAEQVIAFYRALDTITSAASPPEQVSAQKTLRRVLTWLWDAAAEPVLHALGHRDAPAPGEQWPRVWWVPGGLLSLLPIHAAGYHGSPPDPGHRAVMDRIVSSYTATVGALVHARTAPAAAAASANRSLIVAMPTTPDLPGEGRLRYVLAEAALLQARLPHPTMLTETAAAHGSPPDRIPTKATVLEHLRGCAIAHFACHGYTDPADPSRSRLLLHDHRRDPLTVAALAPLALDHAQLAYLSACSTARMTETRLLDEAIHLASAFQLAGFPHVIGTLWEIDDKIAVTIADTFYASLTDPDGTLDPNRAARALHHATCAQRDRQPATAYLWASHIHAGA
jgi:CHAT domain